MKIPPGFERIGTVAVDSGTLMIIDPCYVDEGFDYGTWEPGFDNGLRGVLTSPVSDGVAFSTFYGDGGYPVYGYFEPSPWPSRTGQRRLSAVLIDTNPEYEEEL